MKLTEKLVHLRKEKGMTQSDLAELIHVSRQAVSRWETGDALPSTENLKYLSVLYDVPLDDLLNDDTQEPKKKTEEKAEEKAPGRAGPRSRRAWIAAAAALLVIGLILFIAAMAWPGEQQKNVRSIEDLEQEEVNPDSVDGNSFSIGW